MLKIVVILSFIVFVNGNSLAGNFNVCSLRCSNEGEASSPVTNTRPVRNALRGKSGPRGEKGERGHHGVKGDPGLSCDKKEIEELQSKISALESNVIRKLRPQNCSQIKEHYPEASSGEYTVYESIYVGRQVVCDMMTNEGSEVYANCKEILESNPASVDGVYKIRINSSTNIDVFCDMKGGGWTVFQRRIDGSESFFRNFDTYTNGFGDVSHEFWLGLNNIHHLTSQPGSWTLQIDIETFDGETAYALYTDFAVGEGTDFILSVGEYSGTAGDSLTSHNGYKFSTHDRDQDTNGGNCAQLYSGSWWFNSCLWSNLNSYEYGRSINEPTGVTWYHFKSSWVALKFAQMKAMIISA